MTQGIDTATPPTAFHSDDVEAVADYRSLSALAVVGFILGLLSVLALMWPLLLIVPITGGVVSLIAMGRISASEGLLAGWWLAAMGLALSVAFGVAAISRDAAVRYLRASHAEQFAREWIGLVLAGEMQRAFEATGEGVRPAAPAEPDQPQPTKTPFEEFAERPLVQELAALRPGGTIDLVRMIDYHMYSGQQFDIVQHYRVASGAKAVELVIRLRHGPFGRARAPQWIVVRMDPPEVALQSPR